MDRRTPTSSHSSASPYDTPQVETKAAAPTQRIASAHAHSSEENFGLPQAISDRHAVAVLQKVHPSLDELLAAFPPTARPGPTGASVRECAARMIELAKGDKTLPLAAAMGELVKRLGAGRIDPIMIHELMQALKKGAGDLDALRYGDTIGQMMRAAGCAAINPVSLDLVINHVAALRVTPGLQHCNRYAFMDSAMSALFDSALATSPWEAGTSLRQQVFDALFRADASNPEDLEISRSTGPLRHTLARAFDEHFNPGAPADPLRDAPIRHAQEKLTAYFFRFILAGANRDGALTIGRLNDLLRNERRMRPMHLLGLQTTPLAFITKYVKIPAADITRFAFAYGCNHPASLDNVAALLQEQKQSAPPEQFNRWLFNAAVSCYPAATALKIDCLLRKVEFSGDRRQFLRDVTQSLIDQQTRVPPELAYALLRAILKPASPPLIADALRYVTNSATLFVQPTLVQLARALIFAVGRPDLRPTVEKIAEGLVAALPDGTDMNPYIEALWLASAQASQGDNSLQTRADLLGLLDHPLVREALAGTADAFGRARDQLLALAEVTDASALAAARKGKLEEAVAELESQRPPGQVSPEGAVDVLKKLHDLRFEALAAGDASGAKRTEFLKAEIAHLKSMGPWLAQTDGILALERKLRKLAPAAPAIVASAEG